MDKGFEVYGKPSKGCQHCVRGNKLVLFITGLCSQKCAFCPVSEKKFGKDDIYANEWKIDKINDLYEEIRLMNAKGAGITGGDPLVTLNKTCTFIKKLKLKFGKNFHIHLYTPFKLVNEKTMKKLYLSGLDEIRFHPKLDDDSEWENINFALNYDWDIGIEIPCIPGKLNQMKKMLKFFSDKVKFVNLNELEFSDTIVDHYNMDKYNTKDKISYAAKGSKQAAFQLIDYANKNKFSCSVYFCSSYLKDKIQMGNRIINRAKGSAKSYDIITEEGMLIRGSIYLPELKPGLSYRDNLSLSNRKEILNKLIKIKKLISFECDIDKTKLRLICSPILIEKYKDKIKKLNLVPAIVEEYPTQDAIEIEIDFI